MTRQATLAITLLATTRYGYSELNGAFERCWGWPQPPAPGGVEGRSAPRAAAPRRAAPLARRACARSWCRENDHRAPVPAHQRLKGFACGACWLLTCFIKKTARLRRYVKSTIRIGVRCVTHDQARNEFFRHARASRVSHSKTRTETKKKTKKLTTTGIWHFRIYNTHIMWIHFGRSRVTLRRATPRGELELIMFYMMSTRLVWTRGLRTNKC